MVKARPQRPSADVTRDKILQAALQLFMQCGFAGTSMGKLAEKAKINQTLIFHHFGNKRLLWQQVKAMMIDGIEAEPIDLEPKNLHQFLSEAIEQRVFIYTQCPKLKRLISWQRLETINNKPSLIGIPNSPISPLQWIKPICFLQERKLLNPEWEPKLIITLLVASIDAMFDDDLNFFNGHLKNQKNYINMLINSLTIGLTVANNNIN